MALSSEQVVMTEALGEEHTVQLPKAWWFKSHSISVRCVLGRDTEPNVSAVGLAAHCMAAATLFVFECLCEWVNEMPIQSAVYEDHF